MIIVLFYSNTNEYFGRYTNCYDRKFLSTYAEFMSIKTRKLLSSNEWQRIISHAILIRRTSMVCSIFFKTSDFEK